MPSRIGRIIERRLRHLPQIAEARGGLRRFPRATDRRQQNADQHRDQRDNKKKLDE